MAPQPNHLFEIPNTFHILLRILRYTAGALLSTWGAYHGYRGYRGVPFGREAAHAELLRDQIVFDDDFDKLRLGHDVESLSSAEAKGVFRPKTTDSERSA